MNNIENIINTINGCNNPKQYVLNELQNMAKSNPMISAVIKSDNYENAVRNICKEQGVDVDSMYNLVSNILYRR